MLAVDVDVDGTPVAPTGMRRFRGALAASVPRKSYMPLETELEGLQSLRLSFAFW